MKNTYFMHTLGKVFSTSMVVVGLIYGKEHSNLHGKLTFGLKLSPCCCRIKEIYIGNVVHISPALLSPMISKDYFEIHNCDLYSI